ncbi:MAG: hypothetical protein HOQ01_11480 [Lysobacter sp.]|nr:hypothetical protein [Lysobacter sp.]
MSVTREEHDAKISGLESRFEGRFANIEQVLEDLRGTRKTMVALFIASMGTTLGTGVAVTQAMLSHFDTVLEAYHSGTRQAQDVRVVMLPAHVYAPAPAPLPEG